MRNILLGGLALGWLGLVVSWWMLIPVHYFPEDEMERATRLEMLLAEQRQLALETGEVAKATAPPPPQAPAEMDPLTKAGMRVYYEFECDNCHTIGGIGGKKRKGPALDSIGSVVTAEQLKEKLWDPMAWYAEGFEKEYKKVVMPDNYPELMSETERDALVSYLMTLKDPAGKTPKPVFPE